MVKWQTDIPAPPDRREYPVPEAVTCLRTMPVGASVFIEAAGDELRSFLTTARDSGRNSYRQRACTENGKHGTRVWKVGDGIERLPNRRLTQTMRYQLADGYSAQDYEAQYAFFHNGEVGEVFLVPVGGSGAKIGTPLDNMAKDLSVLFSIARRYGAPVAAIREALSQEADGRMLGPLGEFLRLHAAEEARGEVQRA